MAQEERDNSLLSTCYYEWLIPTCIAKVIECWAVLNAQYPALKLTGISARWQEWRDQMTKALKRLRSCASFRQPDWMYKHENERYEKGVCLSVGLPLHQCLENRKETLLSFFFFFFTWPEDKITSVKIPVSISSGAYFVAWARKNLEHFVLTVISVWFSAFCKTSQLFIPLNPKLFLTVGGCSVHT